MSISRVISLRQRQGLTQERLSEASGVGLRTIQRLEKGEDVSSETLTRVAEALRVPVRELFNDDDGGGLGERIDSLQARADEQQAARQREKSGWRWLYVGVGVVVTLLSFKLGFYGIAVVLAYWVGVTIVLMAVNRLWLQPRLDAKYPLSHQKPRHPQKQPKTDSAEEQA